MTFHALTTDCGDTLLNLAGDANAERFTAFDALCISSDSVDPMYFLGAISTATCCAPDNCEGCLDEDSCASARANDEDMETVCVWSQGVCNDAPGDAVRLAQTAIAYWNFEEGSGNTARDLTGNGHDATSSTSDGDRWVSSNLAGGSHCADFRNRREDTYVVSNKANFPTGATTRTTMAWVKGCEQEGGFITFGCTG